jgi:hypothetical protein
VCRIRKTGFPVRRELGLFLHRYAPCVAPAQRASVTLLVAALLELPARPKAEKGQRRGRKASERRGDPALGKLLPAGSVLQGNSKVFAARRGPHSHGSPAALQRLSNGSPTAL